MSRHHISEPLRALYQVFVFPSLTVRPSSRHFHRASQTLQPIRAFSTTIPYRAGRPPARKPEVRKQKWDEEITARIITLVDEETGKLGPPITRYDVLKNLDKRTHRLVQVSADEPGNRDFVPVCKIYDKKQSYAAEKKRKEALKDSRKAQAVERSVKTLELNWAIDLNDLGHRLEKVREFLAEGRKVEVVLARKKQGRRATKQECEEVLKRIRTAMEEVEGAREVKPLDGKLGGIATVVMAGKAPKTSSTTDTATPTTMDEG